MNRAERRAHDRLAAVVTKNVGERDRATVAVHQPQRNYLRGRVSHEFCAPGMDCVDDDPMDGRAMKPTTLVYVLAGGGRMRTPTLAIANPEKRGGLELVQSQRVVFDDADEQVVMDLMASVGAEFLGSLDDNDVPLS